MDCFFSEGIKVFYRAAMAILLLFYKYSAPQASEWMNEILNNGIDTALTKFCKQMPVSITACSINHIMIKENLER